MKNIPDDNILESLFKKQVQHVPSLREHMAYYDRLPSDSSEKNYQSLVTLVRRQLQMQKDNKIREACEQAARGQNTAAPVQG